MVSRYSLIMCRVFSDYTNNSSYVALVDFFHAILGAPSIHPFLQAIEGGYILVPGLTAPIVNFSIDLNNL